MALMKPGKGRSRVRGKLGDYLLDLSKMVFAGVILASIVESDLPHELVVVSGAGVTVLALFWGMFFISQNEKE
jgi:hypothetical protein